VFVLAGNPPQLSLFDFPSLQRPQKLKTAQPKQEIKAEKRRSKLQVIRSKPFVKRTTKLCDICGLRFTTTHREVLRCSRKCQREAERRRYRHHHLDGISSSKIGTVNELAVIADLLRRNWEVYRAVSADAPCDLAAVVSGHLVRIEVTTGHRNVDGRLAHPKNKHIGTGRFDILAVVVGQEIAYLPELPDIAAGSTG